MPDDQDDDKQPSWLEPAAQVATNMVTTAANALAGTSAGAWAAAASPLVKAAFEGLGTRWRDLTDRGGERVLEEAVHAGLDPERLEEQLAASPQRMMLAGLAMSAGTRTVDEHKLRALGRALAAAVEDDALVDPGQLAIAALADLEPPHVKVLGRMAAPRTDGFTGQVQWSMGGLRRALPEAVAVLGPVVATLERHALVAQVDQTAAAIKAYDREMASAAAMGTSAFHIRNVEPVWVVTDFGRHVLELLREVPSD